jgi:hypothetical protein
VGEECEVGMMLMRIGSRDVSVSANGENSEACVLVIFQVVM